MSPYFYFNYKDFDFCVFFQEDMTVARESITQASSSGSVSATSNAVTNERALIIQAASSYNQGRVFGLGSKAVVAREQLNRGFLSSPESVTQPNIQHLIDKRVEIIRERLVRDHERFKSHYHDYLAQLGQKIGLPPLPQPPTGDLEPKIEMPGDLQFAPPNSHHTVHPRLHLLPPVPQRLFYRTLGVF
jgi:hypothetical protein